MPGSDDLRSGADRPARLLVVVAHPADADHGLGGSVARWVAEGTSAHLVCCTSGDATGPDAAADPLELAARREGEQRAAAAIVGYGEVTFLHRPDGALANDLALREQLTRLVREFRPDTLATCDPRVLIHDWGALNHVDHRAAGEAAIDVVHAGGNAMAFPGLMRSDGLEPHRVRRLLLFSSEHPTHALDVSHHLESKLRALQAHAGREDGMADPGPAGLPAREKFALIDLA